ncbi:MULTISPECIES: hypothetical protein [Microbulbifer]|nr:MULTISPECIES: hypothetical protein [Microbulbifer]
MALKTIRTGLVMLFAVALSACGGGGSGGSESSGSGGGGGSTTVTRTYQLELEEIELNRADSGEALAVEGLPLKGTEVSVTE